MPSYLILVGIVALTVVGDYGLKYASMKTSPIWFYWFSGGAALYALTAVGWFMLMQTHNLAQIAVLYSAATILALTGVGYVFFNESITPRQAAGISTAILSIFLMETAS